MSKITDEILRQIMPHAPKAKRQASLPILNQVAFHYGITTERRLSAWLATLAVESGELRYQEEIADGQAYEGRKDLGNTQPGDGKRFKGHGRIQITGRANHKSYTDYLNKSAHLPFIDFVQNPRALASEPYATDSAGWFFAVHIDANPLADQNKFLAIQIKVNGRNRKTNLPNHWPERKAYYERGLRVIPDDFELEAGDEESDIPPIIHSTEGYPDYEAVEVVDTSPTETSVTVTDGNVKVETSEGTKPAEKIAIEKPEPLNFSTTMRNKIATVTGGNLTLQGVRDYAEQARFLGLSARFWFWVSLIALIGTAIYLISAFYKHRSDVKRDMEITNSLIASNSTPQNRVELVDKGKLSEYEKLGYKIISR